MVSSGMEQPKISIMSNLQTYRCKKLDPKELMIIQGGGPIKEALEWYYKTVGSFYRGIYDGLMGHEPVL